MEMKGRPEAVGLRQVSRIRTRIPKAKIRFKLVKGIKLEINKLGAAAPGKGCTFFFLIFATTSEIIMENAVNPATITKGRAPPFFFLRPTKKPTVTRTLSEQI